jgi:hypothetical protein
VVDMAECMNHSPITSFPASFSLKFIHMLSPFYCHYNAGNQLHGVPLHAIFGNR